MLISKQLNQREMLSCAFEPKSYVITLPGAPQMTKLALSLKREKGRC